MELKEFKLPAAPLEALHKIHVDFLKGLLVVTYSPLEGSQIDLQTSDGTIDFDGGVKVTTNVINPKTK